jgi:hypothetical protein
VVVGVRLDKSSSGSRSRASSTNWSNKITGTAATNSSFRKELTDSRRSPTGSGPCRPALRSRRLAGRRRAIVAHLLHLLATTSGLPPRSRLSR